LTPIRGLAGEVRHLEARAQVGLELEREQVAAVGLERLEGRRRRRGPVGHRLGRDRDVDRRADRLEQRQHRRRPARAVEADERRAGVGEPAARLDVARSRRRSCPACTLAKVTIAGRPSSWHTSSPIRASPT
jgi:hypothetical protein